MCYSCCSAAAPSASTRSSNLGPQILVASCRLQRTAAEPDAKDGSMAPVAAASLLTDSSCSFKTPQVPPQLLHSCSSMLQVAACNSLLPCVSAANKHLRWQQLVLLTNLTSLPSFVAL